MSRFVKICSIVLLNIFLTPIVAFSQATWVLDQPRGGSIQQDMIKARLWLADPNSSPEWRLQFETAITDLWAYPEGGSVELMSRHESIAKLEDCSATIEHPSTLICKISMVEAIYFSKATRITLRIGEYTANISARGTGNVVVSTLRAAGADDGYLSALVERATAERKWPFQEPDIVYIVNDPEDGWLNLRSGPSSDFGILRRMDNSMRVKILEENGKWAYIETPSKDRGWAYRPFLTLYRWPTVSARQRLEQLATGTGGGVFRAQRARDVPGRIFEIVDNDAQSFADIAFLIDATGSMEDDIREIKGQVAELIDNLPFQSYVSLSTFGDRQARSWFWFSNLTNDHAEVQSQVRRLEANADAGGDTPESTFDAAWEVLQRTNWESYSTRMLIVLTDADPHTGSKTRYSERDVVRKAKEAQVKFHLLQID